MTDEDVQWLSDAWLMDMEFSHGHKVLHALWPDPAGVATYEQLPNHSNVLLKLRMTGLDSSETNRLERVMEKVTPFPSGARALGNILQREYEEPAYPHVRHNAKPETTKRILRLWKEECTKSHEFRLIFNHLTWITTQGLYKRARPQKSWSNAIYCHVAITRRGHNGVVNWLASTGRPDKEWHMIPLAILREYMCALFDANPWFTEAHQDSFDFTRFKDTVTQLCDALRDGFSSMDNAITTILPFKDNTTEKMVMRHSNNPVMETIRKQVRGIITDAMLMYFSIRVDMLPRLRGPPEQPKSLSFGHAAFIWRLLSHLRPYQISDRLRAWSEQHVAKHFPHLKGNALSERMFKWVYPTKKGHDQPSKDLCIPVPASDVAWMMEDLCALAIHLLWSPSGQLEFNIRAFLARQPPEERTFVAPLTMPELGGVEEDTARIIQETLLTDPTILLPKRLRLRYHTVSLWDARVILWWIIHNESLNSISLAPRPRAEMNSVRNVAWKEFSGLYGATIGTKIVQNGGLLHQTHEEPPQPCLPAPYWTIYYLPCCDSICSKLEVNRLVYDYDMGCMLCRNGLPRKHSAGPASTDRIKTYIVVDALNHDYMAKFHQGYAYYDAQTEKDQCSRVANEYAALVKRGYGAESERLLSMSDAYQREIKACVYVRRDQIQEEKLGGTEHGSHRTARSLTAFAAELRAYATGDASYCVPLANEHEITMECPRRASILGFWWAAEHQILETTGNPVTRSPAQCSAFWDMVIPPGRPFVDSKFRHIFETMSPNLKIGGTGLKVKGSPYDIITNDQLFKVVRTGPKQESTVPCVAVPATPLFVRGMRLIKHHPSKNIIDVYSHCICCGKWSGDAETCLLDGARVCSSCQPKITIETSCSAPKCNGRHTSMSPLKRLLVRQDACLVAPDVAMVPFEPTPARPCPWAETWWCPNKHEFKNKLAHWVQYHASLEWTRHKLRSKDKQKRIYGR